MNLHTHSTWCDGKDTPDCMAEAAYKKGFTVLGFSSHAMLPATEPGYLSPETAPAYFADIRRLARDWEGRLEIRCGVEADFIPGVATPDRASYAAFLPDYIIGSIHYVVRGTARVPVDNTPELLLAGIREVFGGDAKAFICAYFAQEREMARRFDFDIVGHPDLVRKFNGRLAYFDESAEWYRAEVTETAAALAASGKTVEINTGGISRGWMTDAYPSAFFRNLLAHHGVPTILSSDAHTAEGV